MTDVQDDDVIVQTKFLIRASSNMTENILALPMVHMIRENAPKPEINVIIDKGAFNPFALLPFEINTYEIDPKDKGVLSVHKFAYNLTGIFNVDYYIDLGGTVSDAVMGATFRSTKRIGFSKGISKLLFTDSVPLENFVDTDGLYMKFLKFMDIENPPAVKKFNGFKKVKSKDPENEGSYLLVIIDHFYLDDEQNHLWLDFFDSLISDKVAIYFKNLDLPEGVDELEYKRQLIEKWDKRNKYIFVPEFTPATFKVLAESSSAVVTDVLEYGLAASYVMARTFCFVAKNSFPTLKHFEKLPEWVITEEGNVSKIIGNLENKNIGDISEVANELYREESGPKLTLVVDNAEAKED